MDPDFQWKADIYGLPGGGAKCLFNSVLKSLFNKDNLHKLRNVTSPASDFETISHVLSGCKVVLDQGCYTWWHDSVLNQIQSCISKSHLPNITIHTDLGDQSWTIPPDILSTIIRPHLVVIDYNRKSISIIESPTNAPTMHSSLTSKTRLLCQILWCVERLKGNDTNPWYKSILDI